MRILFAMSLFALMGCVNPPKNDYYKDIKEEEYDYYRFKDEIPLPEYKRSSDEKTYYEEDRQKW
jgi:hypothetical protein